MTIILYGKTDLPDVIKDLEIGKLFWIIWVALHLIPESL